MNQDEVKLRQLEDIQARYYHVKRQMEANTRAQFSEGFKQRLKRTRSAHQDWDCPYDVVRQNLVELSMRADEYTEEDY